MALVRLCISVPAYNARVGHLAIVRTLLTTPAYRDMSPPAAPAAHASVASVRPGDAASTAQRGRRRRHSIGDETAIIDNIIASLHAANEARGRHRRTTP